MARLELKLDANGVKTGSELAAAQLNVLKQRALAAEEALSELRRKGNASALKLAEATNKAAIAQDRFARATSGALSTVNRGGAGGIQNVAFQIGDFATQVGAGTDASIALGQQLPQLLGGFGAVGAIAGAAVATLVPLGAAFLDLEDKSEALSDSVASLEDSVEGFIDRSESAKRSLADLSSEFGSFAEQAREVFQTLAFAEFDESIEGVADSVSRLSQAFNNADFETLAEVFGRSSEFDTVGDVNRLLLEDLRDLEAAFTRLGAAEGLNAQIDAAQSLLSAFDDLAASSGDLNETERAFVEELGRAILRMQTLAEEADSVAPGIDAAAAAAERLTRQLAAAQSQINAQTLVGGGRGGDPRDFEASPGTRLDASALIAADRRAESVAARSGGGGGGGGASRAARELERQARAYERLRGQLDPAFRAQTQFNSAVETLNGQLAAGKISQEEYNEVLAQATDRFNDAIAASNSFTRFIGNLSDQLKPENIGLDSLRTFNSTLTDVLTNPFQRGESALVSFVNSFQSLFAQLLSAQVTRSFANLFGGFFGGAPRLFDAGGTIPAGGVGIVAERRPEIVNGSLVSQPTLVRGPANVTGGRETSQRLRGGAPQINNIITFDVNEVMARIAQHPDFEQNVVNVMREYGAINA